MRRSLFHSGSYTLELLRPELLAVLALAVALTAAPAVAQVKITTTEPGQPAQEVGGTGVTMTRAELAQLIFRVFAPDESVVPDPITAFADLRDFGLIPEHWNESEIVTQADLAEILHRLGVLYRPATPDGPVSRAYTEALLRRNLGPLKHYLGRHLDHDLGVTSVVCGS
jgi:hypothetical protein